MGEHILNLEEFINTHITSLDHLRTLLLCRKSPDAAWNAIEVGHKLDLPPGTAARLLAELTTKRLLVSAGEPGRYHYKSQSPELARLVEQLAEIDRVQPVTLVRLVSRAAGNSRAAPPLSSSPMDETIQ